MVCMMERMARTGTPENRRTRTRPTEIVVGARKQWQAKLKQWISAGNLRSEDIAEQASKYLAKLGDGDTVSTATINHFRSQARLPQSDRLFSALVWALDDLGVFDKGADERAGIGGADRKRQIKEWGDLIGRALNSDRPIVSLPPSTSGRVALRRFLTAMTDQHIDLGRPPVIQVFSSTEFLAGLEPGIASAIASCAESGISVVYVFGPHWGLTERWEDDLADMLLSRIPENNPARQRLFSVTLRPTREQGGHIGGLAELWVRLGLYSVPAPASPNLEGGVVSVQYLRTLDVARAWIYFEPSQDSHGAQSGEAALLRDVLNSRVRDFWRSVPDSVCCKQIVPPS